MPVPYLYPLPTQVDQSKLQNPATPEPVSQPTPVTQTATENITQNAITNPTTTTNSSVSNINNTGIGDSRLNLDLFNFAGILNNLHLFLLVWTIVFAGPLVIEFIFYRFFLAKGRLKYIQKSNEALAAALKIIASYAVCVIFLVLTLNNFLGLGLILYIVTIILHLAKIYLDLLQIFGVLDFFGWSKNLFGKVRKQMLFEK